jgi:hypothetical protein
VHGRVGAFYALYAGEGKQILQHDTSKSVETMRGYTTRQTHRRAEAGGDTKGMGQREIFTPRGSQAGSVQGRSSAQTSHYGPWRLPFC